MQIREENGPAERVDCVVIGAGVVGLAVARRLALAGREVIVIEAEDAIGTGTSSRNSEVIHAGIYYPRGSLKARLCVAGRKALYAYCAARGIPHRNCGKLIVATDEAQLVRLDEVRARAAANGVTDLRPIDGATARALEPALSCLAALEVPATGIVDSHALMLSYQGDAERHGAVVALCSPVTGGRAGEDGLMLQVGGAEPCRLACRLVVNAAGLAAQAVARAIDGIPPAAIPPLHLAKGNYFTLTGRPPFRRLIYPAPVPGAGGLGVHVTLDLAGQVRFGPDVEWVDRIGYDVDPARGERFYAAIRTYWPDLPDGALQPGYAGIRPKLVPAGVADPDFLIQGPRDHGIPGLVNLYGIESPGLTASLAIAEWTAALLLGGEPDLEALPERAAASS